MFNLSKPKLGPLERPLRAIRSQLPPLNFITVHYAYFLAVCLLAAIIFWGSSTHTHVSFTDSLFLAVSAMTEAGLNTVNLSELNTFQQFILFLLIMLGSAIWVSAFVVHVRKNAFERKFGEIIERQRARSRERRERSSSRSRIGTLLGRRSGEGGRDTEAGHATEEKQHEDSDRSASAEGVQGDAPKSYSALDGKEERDQTPPARRGGPEMNDSLSRHASATGGDAVISDTEEEEDHAAHGGAANHAITFAGNTRFGPSSPPIRSQPVRRRGSNLFTMQGVGARPSTTLQPSSPIARTSSTYFQYADPSPTAPAKGSRGDISQYFDSVSGWTSRNSQFHGLSEKEREKLGGYEYRAVSLLAWLVPVYFVLWQLLGCIGCAAWVALHAAGKSRRNGLNPWWVGAFNAVSAFNNSGMSLLDANMTAFQRSIYLLITMSLLILAGNTMFPVFLRAIVWCMWKAVSSDHLTGEAWDERARTLRFLLDHPRRCYTNLFPSQHTWWLMWSVILLNGVDWAAFEILNINNEALDDGLPANYRVIDGLFQAFAVRSGGFYVVSIPTLRISLQVMYVVMMYISAYPVAMTMRNSNVYEERSLGIYAEDQGDDDDDGEAGDSKGGEKEKRNDQPPGFLLRRAQTIRAQLSAVHPSSLQKRESNTHFVRHQLRAQLAHDAWWIVLALFLIMIIENDAFKRNPAVYSVFNFIFEIVSAYGCVGISVGVPWAAYSFCGSWTTLSKLILCAVMLRGRHRGLPVAIDKAVLLPGEAHLCA